VIEPSERKLTKEVTKKQMMVTMANITPDDTGFKRQITTETLSIDL